MSVTLYLGPMCSGKSSAMFRQATRACFAKIHVDILVYKNSQRTEMKKKNTLFSHNTPLQLPSPQHTYLTVREHTSIQDYINTNPDAQHVGIDEGQFFGDLRPGVQILLGKGIHVYISALNGDFQLRPWASISNLLPIATEIHMLKAICTLCKEDHKDAHYTMMTHAPQTSVGVNDPCIGGTDMYVSTCWKHFHT